MAVKIVKGDAAGLINLTPMIDVVFQLLLFFLVASRFADEEHQMHIKLPEASEARPISAKVDKFFVNVDREGKTFLGTAQVTPRELEARLRQLAANNPGRENVVIRGDANCPHKHIVAVMNACNKANIRNYLIDTLKSDKK